MATQRERILEYLRARPNGADDGVLAGQLGIAPRQTVNQICLQLARQGVLVRGVDRATGRFVNRLADASSVPAPAAPRPPRAGLTDAMPASRRVTIEVAEEIRRFAYAGEVHLTEDQVKEALEAMLRNEGWRVGTHWGRAHGIDIDAHRGAERLVIEAKGEGSRQAMRVNFFLGALGELLQRMDSPDASYGLALPAHRQFAGLVSRLPAWVRARLNLRFYLVRPAPDGYEVGVFSSREAAEARTPHERPDPTRVVERQGRPAPAGRRGGEEAP